MPPVSPSELVNAIFDAIEQSGGSAVYLSDTIQTHPRIFGVEYPGNSFAVWIYIWTLTHGGRASLPNEYRIQMTTVASPLPLNTDGITLLMGFHPESGVFGGFDLQMHQTFTVGSPSVQINLDTLQEARQHGLGFGIKDNQEIAIGVRADQFLNYVLNASSLHSQSPDVLPILRRVVALEDVDQEVLDRLPPARRRIISKVTRRCRDADFNRRVLDAYSHQCAVTRIQLRLLDAAHIVPVAVEGSTDETTNGIALSPTMHRAFDNALIYLDEDRMLRLNQVKADELLGANQATGLDYFGQLVDRRIYLPTDQNLWPSEQYIRQANRHRRIPGY